MEIIIALTFVFHQAISPNLDLFYFLSIALIGKDVLQRKTITLKAMGYVYLIILYALLQLVLNDSIEIQRLIINIAKIFVNVFLFLQVREIFLPQLSFKKILDTISISYFVLLLVGLVYKTDLLWRLDDQVNIYQKLRFSLLYFEPSEASFHVCIVIILLMYYVLREKDSKRNCLNLLLVISNAIIVILTAGMGGILGVSLALVFMYLCYLKEKISVERVLMFIALFMICSFAIFIFINSSNGFYLRINDIAAGRDGSVVYRFNTSFEIMKLMLLKTNFLGIGFGNLNTSAIQGGYAEYGLVEVISNSFMYVIAEGGIAMIILLIVFHIEMIRRIRIDERILKYSLLIFIFSYQVAGGYFTNPINWIIYGLIANTVFMRKDLLQCNFQVYRSTMELKNNM